MEKLKVLSQPARLRIFAAVLLLIGLSGSVAIYLTAADDSFGVLGYEIIDGQMYPIVPDKMYTHNLKQYGGAMFVFADDLSRWFSRLWHGRSLAYTIAAVTALISFGSLFFANLMSSSAHKDLGAKGENSSK